MAKACPRCHSQVEDPKIEGRSTHIDFTCVSCGAELRLSFSLVFILALVCAVPCIVCSYEYFPKFTFIIGDALIFLGFALLFWPLRTVRLRSENGSHV